MRFRHFRAPGLAGIIVLAALSYHALSQGVEGDSTAIPRLGAEIDTYEREYFGLFPTLEDFSTATISSAPDSSLRFAVRRESHPDTIYALVPSAALDLKICIASFEKFLLFRWEKYVHRPDLPGCISCVFDTLAQYRIMAADSRTVRPSKPFSTLDSTGGYPPSIYPVAVYDTILIGQSTDELYRWSEFPAHAVIITPGIMPTVRTHADFLTGAALGMLAGFGAVGYLFSSWHNVGNSGGIVEEALEPAVLSAAFAGALAGGVSFLIPVTYDARSSARNREFHAFTKYYQSRTIFQSRIPPEIRRFLLTAYSIPITNSGRSRLPGVPDGTGKLLFHGLLEVPVALYPGETRHMGIGIGAALGIDIQVPFLETPTAFLRPSLGIGFEWFRAGVDLRIPLFRSVSVSAGGHFMTLKEVFGSYSNNGLNEHGYDEGLEQRTFTDKLFLGGGIDVDFDDISLHVAYRACMGRPFSTQWDYEDEPQHHRIHTVTVSMGTRF